MDAHLFRLVNRFADHTAWAHGPARFYATYGIVLAGLLLLAAWWDARSAEDPVAAVAAVAWAGAAALVGVGLVQVIGGAIDRARPTTVLHGTHLLLARTADFSFPSDHSTAMGAVTVGLLLAGPLLRHRWYGWAALGCTLLMMFDRVYVGAHYPADVLAGFALGALVAAGLGPIGRWVFRRIAELIASSPLRPVVAVGQP